MNASSRPSSHSAPAIEVNKWIVAVTVMFGAFMAVMDISVVNVAMPHMMGTFSEDLSSITWVATAYSIAEIIMVSMAGWLSTLIGRKNLYLWSFGLFTLGSVLCGTAMTFHQILFYRVLQGVGGGALIPVSQAILRESFPEEEQGMAMAIFGMGVVLAPAIGPIVGGWLTDHYGWPWIFFINVPVSLAGILMVGSFVHDPEYLRRGVRRIDWGGIGLLTVALTSMQIVLERGERVNWFDSTLVIAGSVICVVAVMCLLYRELKTPEPVIKFRLLRNMPLALGSLMGLIFGVALFGTTFILPQFTQVLLGYPALQAGLVLAPRAVMLMLFMPIVGWFYNHVDARVLVVVGIVIIFWAYYDLAKLSLDAGFWNLVPALLIMGTGMPFNFVTLTTLSLATVPRPDMTDATSLYTLARRVGGNIGYALAATLVDRGEQIHRAYLVSHVNPSNPAFAQYSRAVAKMLARADLNPHNLHGAVYALTDRIINRQASMMAYNDVSWVFGILFVCTIPLVLLLPSRSAIRASRSGPDPGGRSAHRPDAPPANRGQERHREPE
jgi:DHA2 family multidrug resistance protein